MIVLICCWVNKYGRLTTKMAKSGMSITNLSPTYSTYNIRHQHRFCLFELRMLIFPEKFSRLSISHSEIKQSHFTITNHSLGQPSKMMFAFWNWKMMFHSILMGFSHVYLHLILISMLVPFAMLLDGDSLRRLPRFRPFLNRKFVREILWLR